METPTPKKRRGLRAFVILGVISALGIGGYLFHAWWVRGKVTTDDAQVDADVVPLAARTGGVALVVHVHDHQRVAAGDVVLELDPADADAKLRVAEADLEAARAQAEAADAQVEIVRAASTGGKSSADANLSATGAGVRGAAAQVKVAEAALARAKADLKRLDTDLARDEKLSAQGALSATAVEAVRSQRDAASAAVDLAQAQVTGAREAQRLAQAKVAEAKGRVEQSTPVDAQVRAAEAAQHLANAKIHALEAALAQAKLVRSYTTVVAPHAGTISRLAVREGQLVSPGQTLVMLVPDETYVVANFKETEVASIRPGQPVDVELDAFPDEVLHGEVDSIAAATGARFSLLAPDNATGNYVKVVQRVPVKIRWKAEPTIALRPGLSAEVTVHVN